MVGVRLGLAEHIQDTNAIFSLVLDEDDVNSIREATAKGKDLLKVIGDCGDEYRRAWVMLTYQPGEMLSFIKNKGMKKKGGDKGKVFEPNFVSVEEFVCNTFMDYSVLIKRQNKWKEKVMYSVVYILWDLCKLSSHIGHLKV